MKTPVVTVGMPIFNRAGVLRETIQYVLDQTYRDFEFIIYNDGSTDGSDAIVREFEDERIIFIDKTNKGPPYPLNAIYRRARGEFVIILHDHDIFDPRLLELSVAALQQNSDLGFVLQGNAWIAEDGASNYREMIHDLPTCNGGRAFGEKMLCDNRSFSSIFHACCMVRRSALEKVGMWYNPSFGLYSDVDLWFRLLFEFPYGYLPTVLFKFRERETVGHFLNGSEFQVLESVIRIHVENIDRYFKDQPEKRSIARSALSTRCATAERNLAFHQIFVNNDVQKAKEVLDRVVRNPSQSSWLRISLAIVSIRPVCFFVSRLFSVIHYLIIQFRKSF